MKHLFILALIFGIATSAMAVDISKCTKVIEKVAENHVLIKYVLYDAKGKEVVVSQEEYGQDRIDKEKAVAQAEFDKWDKLDAEQIAKNKADAQTSLNDISLIQTSMDNSVISK